LGVRGPKSKIEEQRFVECHMEKWRPKWLDSIEKQKRRSNLRKCDRQTDRGTSGQTSGQTDSVNC